MPLLLEECIPIDKKKLQTILQDSLPEEDRATFEHFARLLKYSCHYKFQTMLSEVCDSYQPFHHNNGLVTYAEQMDNPRYAQNLIDRLKKFLEEAQYQKISEYDIRDLLYFQRSLLKIVFPVEKYQEFCVYFSGEDSSWQPYRSWHTLWLTRRFKQVRYYKKLVVLFRPFKILLKQADANQYEPSGGIVSDDVISPQPMLLKLFQNIPYDYLPIIFPDALFKIPFSKRLWWTVLLGASGVMAILSMTMLSPWYGTVCLLPLLLFLHNVWHYTKQKESYYQKLLSHFYSNNLSNNQGIFRHLIDQAEDETYKQMLVIFHAFWRKESWAFSSISKMLLSSYLEKFLLEYCGVKNKLNLESILVEMGNFLDADGTDNHWLPMMLGHTGAERSYLQQDAAKEAGRIQIEAASQPLARAGVITIAPGTERCEQQVFHRNAFLLEVADTNGLKCSHPPGSAIRWLLDKPHATQLARDCQPGNNCLEVEVKDTPDLPLQGIGKIVTEEGSCEFRYYRQANSNQLWLTAGLRYRHSHTPDAPILVRPVLPSFLLSIPLIEGASEVPLPRDVHFPAAGLVKLSFGGSKEFIAAYNLIAAGKSSCLQLDSRLPYLYETGTLVTLTPPAANLKHGVEPGVCLIPVTTTKNFGRRGILILAPGTEQEERSSFSREALLVELDSPLENFHIKGSFVQLDRTNKTKIMRKAKSGDKSILIHSTGEEITDGTMIISPGQNHQEVRQFHITDKYLYLGRATQFAHATDTQVWEANMESQLRYEAHQGSHMITVENAGAFPAKGVLEIHFNGDHGVKEVFPFQHVKGSNTLLLISAVDRLFAAGSKVLISAVEVTTDTTLHYHDKQIKADFSCVPDFPERGKIVLEPGSQAQEEVDFQRHPARLHLRGKLKNDHSKGTVVSFASYAELPIVEPLAKNTDRLVLEIGYLLPDRGCLVLKNGEPNDIIWYRKIPYRVLLERPCRFHHTRGSRVYFPGIEDNVSIAKPIEKGDQELKVVNGQELPKRGKIKIKGLFRSVWTEYVREDDILYLQHPVPYNFPLHTYLSFPEVFLHSHLTPSTDYVEVSDPSLLPESGELVLEKAPRGIYGPNRQEERIAFRYSPDILWLDAPLSRRYESGTVVYSPELFIRGVGGFQLRSLRDSAKELQEWLAKKLDLVS